MLIASMTFLAALLGAAVVVLVRRGLRKRRPSPAVEPVSFTRCGTGVLESGGTIIMGFGSTVEEWSLDEDGELKVRTTNAAVAAGTKTRL